MMSAARLHDEGFVIIGQWLDDHRRLALLAELDDFLSSRLPADEPPGCEDRRLALAVDMPHRAAGAAAELAADSGLVDLLARSLGRPAEHLWLASSSYYIKQPGQRGQPWHQDEWFATMNGAPGEVVTAWIALEATGPDNGGLEVIPGSHRALLPADYTTDKDEHVLTHEVSPAALAQSTGEAVALQVAAGGLVVLHGLVCHRSNRNRGTATRRAIVLQYVADPDNTSTQREHVFAGSDRPSIRLDGNGE